MYATLDGNKWWCITLMKQYHNKSTKLSVFCHFGLVFYMILWQSPDNPIMSRFHVSALLRVCSSLVSCWRVVFGSRHSCLEFRFRVGVRTLALGNHGKTLRYGNSFPPTFPEDLLAHASPNDWPIVAKHANMTNSRGCINAEPMTITSESFSSLCWT